MAKTNGKVEKNEGSWVSWSDFLGTTGQGGMWSRQTLLKFLEEYRGNIISAESAELLIILQNAGLEYKLDTNEKFKKIILNKEDSEERETAIDAYIAELRQQLGKVAEDLTDEEILDGIDNGDIVIPEAEVSDTEDIEEILGTNLPVEKIIDSMKLYDHEYIHLENLDAEKVRFLIENRINKLWNFIINEQITAEAIIADDDKKYFTQIRNAFLAEYNDVVAMQNPEGYSFEYEPSLMQKLIAFRLKTRKFYGNWSGVGAGKTLASVYGGRYVNAKNTLVVTFNSTVSGWGKSLKAYFNDSVVYDKKMKEVVFEEGKNNYLILNYEFFQQGQRSENRLYEFMDRNRIDYVILDEVHSVKQREEDETLSLDEQEDSGMLSSRRRLMMKFINDIKEKNPEAYLMVMTATPIINNLVEAKKLLELLQGEKYSEIGTNVKSVKSALEYHKHMVTNGIRYQPQYDIKTNTTIIDVDGSDLLFRLEGNRTDLAIEQIVLDKKLEAIRPYIRKGSVIYTYYVEEVAEKINAYVKALGFRTGLYTGRQTTEEREKAKQLFQEGKIDILIGSTPIGTGVDGLQKVCDRIILMSLPWTHSEYEQLIGRIIRQGSIFSVVDVIIPKVVVKYADKSGNEVSWSRDRHKLNVIHFKKDLFGIVVDGIIPDNIVSDLAGIKRKSLESLNSIIARVKSGELDVSRENIIKEFLEHSDLDSYRRKLGAFSEMQRDWSTKNSKTNFDSIQKDPDLWKKYHENFREIRKDWSRETTPCFVIADKINKLNKPNFIIADLGCGDNLLKNEVQNKVLSFDMGKNEGDDTVTICDISNLPIADGSVHVGVFSLTLMGTNYKEYLKEAKRVIVPGGKLFVAEPFQRWQNRENGIDELKSEIEAEGFDVIGNVITTDKFIYIDAVNCL